jgi:hypothetical protein
MEAICDALKVFLLNDLPVVLAQAETQDITLPALSAKTITIGGVDLQKHSGDVEAFIVPDRQDSEELSLAAVEASTPIELLLVVRRKDPEVLYRRALRYAACIKRALRLNPTMGGAVIAATVPAVEYFRAVEADEGVKAVSITIVVTTEEMEE